MNIIYVKKNNLDKDYLIDRDIFWDIKSEEFKKNKEPLWNGSVYYMANVDKDNYSIGLCEYKDILFSESVGIEKIKDKYNGDNNFVYINVQILVEGKDGYVFGTKKIDIGTEIISVGGTLRLEDKEEIKSFYDIKKYAKKEVDIETNLSIEIDDLKYLDVVMENNICTFIFNYRLEDGHKSNLLKIGEFDGEITIIKDKIFNSEKIYPNVRLRSIRDFVENL